MNVLYQCPQTFINFQRAFEAQSLKVKIGKDLVLSRRNEDVSKYTCKRTLKYAFQGYLQRVY